jgi:hypothetical protein
LSWFAHLLSFVGVVKILEGIVCFEVNACANLGYEKHLQGHLKRACNHKVKGRFSREEYQI